MKLEAKEILELVAECEDERVESRRLMEEWENLWSMNVWDRTWQDAIRTDGYEQVTLPTTFNTVQLAMRLFSDEVKIEVPACHPTDEGDETAAKREKWLRAMYEVVNHQQRRNLLQDLVWQSLVRGRHCVAINWIRDELPERMQEKRFPILIRTLDPMNVGVKQGPLYVEHAFHKYRQPFSMVKQRYPTITRRRRSDSLRYRLGDDEEVEVVDFWYQDGDGVWNAVLVEDEFAKPFKKTDYPDIPIIEGYGDSAPINKEMYRGLSILHPIKELYKYQCRLASQIATGVMYYFWPMLVATNESGMEIPDFKVRPGQVIPMPMGSKIEPISPQPNVPLAQAIQSQVDINIQQGTFPGVMYGESGAMQAGYGVSLLSDAAKGRINNIRFGLERTLEQLNIMALSIVEQFGGEDGVTAWGKHKGNNEMYQVALTKDDVNGYYENQVSVMPLIPQDIVQRQTLGLRQIEAGAISKRTYRDKYLDITVPDDEALRVEYERALEDPGMRPGVMLDTMLRRFPDDWQEVIKGTPLEQVAQQKGLLPPPPPPPGPPMGGMPPGMPPGPMPPMGPPPPGMPPGMGGPPMGPGPIQPASPNLDAGTIPPEMAGQMTPEMMGLPPDMDPMLWAQLMGRPIPPADELDRLSGI